MNAKPSQAPKTRIVALANFKGGVGKTTTAVNLAGALIFREKRVLLIDLDAQCNASTALNLTITAEKLGTRFLLSQPEYGIAACAYPRGPYLDVVPADPDLLDLEQQLLVAPDGRLNLRSKLASGIGPYDFVLIDCPPSIGALTQCALVAATEVIKAILALEKKAVSQVVYEVIEQTIGWEDPGGRGGQREWVRLSLRHFQMACAMSLSQAQSGLKIAIQNGYITSRPDRARGGYEYSIVWRDADRT